MASMDNAALFAEHRSTMLGAAYRILGSRDDAEDVVQDAWETWSRIDPTTVDSPRAFLGVMASRLALNEVRSQARRRETYIGPWVPEPIVDDASPEWRALHLDGLGQALDFVLSTLTPEQATAYVLRKVLDVDYASIADVLETSPTAARQQVSRAQRAVSAALGDLDETALVHDARALAALADAVTTGDITVITALLAPDAVLYSDGGGKANAARRPILGPDRIARFLIGLATERAMQVVPTLINGGPGALVIEAGVVTTTITLARSADGIRTLLFVRNPDKLAAIPTPA